MKITRDRLIEIIKEEVTRLNEEIVQFKTIPINHAFIVTYKGWPAGDKTKVIYLKKTAGTAKLIRVLEGPKKDSYGEYEAKNGGYVFNGERKVEKVNTSQHDSVVNEFSMPSDRWVDYNLSSIDRDGIQTIWSMYTDSYFKQGMDLSANSASEMQSKYKAVALKDVDSDHEPDAFIIYKLTPFGNKVALLGTNGKSKAKSDLVKRVIELVKTSGWFIEASKRMEEILNASGAPVVTDERLIQKIVGPDKKVQMVGDGYYTRSLSKVDKRITKRIYGKPR